MTLVLRYIARSDRGLVRSNNEDSVYAGARLLALADGMGGHAAGEVASQLMVNHLERLDADPDDNDMLALLGGVADDANRQIAQAIRDHPETDGMGTTLTALMFNGRSFGLIHVGDSRGYRLREGALEQITVDDTFVQSLVDEGKLDPADVSSHPQKSLILKAYTGRPVEPTLRDLDARPGDRILLCSDGLSDPVTASTIEQTLSEGTPADAARRLIELALRSGGPDNITVVVADVVETDELDDAARAALPATPVTAGALLGGHARVGFENNLHLTDGALAPLVEVIEYDAGNLPALSKPGAVTDEHLGAFAGRKALLVPLPGVGYGLKLDVRHRTFVDDRLRDVRAVRQVRRIDAVHRLGFNDGGGMRARAIEQRLADDIRDIPRTGFGLD